MDTLYYTAPQITRRNAIALAGIAALSGAAILNTNRQAAAEEPKPAYEDSTLNVTLGIIDTLPTVEFGTYPATADGTPAPITWYIVTEQDDKQLLLAKNVLDCKPMNTEMAKLDWETCSLRSWLNSEFLEIAFSADEAAQIAEVSIKDAGNGDFFVEGMKETTDRIFIPSMDELDTYFGAKTWTATNVGYTDLVGVPTEYAIRQGAYTDRVTNGTFWWLRTGGSEMYGAYMGVWQVAIVYADGLVGSYGAYVTTPNIGVRPALWKTA